MSARRIWTHRDGDSGWRMYRGSKYIGDVVVNEGGECVFFAAPAPEANGYWNAFVLRDIADKLDDLTETL